jgi:3-oxoacyl-[acyl-carrier protein] reductase
MKNIFLLGGSGDIGKAISAEFKRKDYRVICPTRNDLNLENRVDIECYFDRNEISPDALIYCAGWNEPKPFQKVTFIDLDKANSINVLSFYRIIQLLLPKMVKKNGGHILAISSLYSLIAREGRLPYVMSKHALGGLVKTLAIELGKFNIKINTLSPGFVNTKMTRKNNSKKTIKILRERIPLKRLAATDEVAKAAFFLCSKENTYITGQNIIIDGGYSVGGFQK